MSNSKQFFSLNQARKFAATLGINAEFITITGWRDSFNQNVFTVKWHTYN